MAHMELLGAWYNKAKLFTSDFHIRRPIERQYIEFIHDTLLLSFSKNYFRLRIGEEISSDKINWLKSLLLASDRLGSVKALYEICLLIRYAGTLPENIQKEFKDLQKSPFNLRSFLFELYIFRVLDFNSIPNIKKPFINGQMLEGYCLLKGKQFIFECKQLYMPNLEELFVVQRLIKDFQQKGNALSNLNGFIAAIAFKKPVRESHRRSFGEKITSFYKSLPNGVETDLNYLVTDDFGEIKAVSFSKEKLALLEAERKYDLIYYLRPTLPVKLDGTIFLEGKITGFFNIHRDKIYRKLEDVLKKEKKQHNHDQYPYKILFIGSESFSEFQFGLFHTENMFDRERVTAIFNKLKLRCILCIIRRYYQADQPTAFVDVFYPIELKGEGVIIQQLFSRFV